MLRLIFTTQCPCSQLELGSEDVLLDQILRGDLMIFRGGIIFFFFFAGKDILLDIRLRGKYTLSHLILIFLCV